ncbi:excisionase [Enterococcus hulanensis]|uniref:excisionase n=1 Tax=Enterococcus hulanensis TaxID=2559929 RepID=UPI00289117DB|nr:excisionase [Enterococcus hulanensis]MDT2661064.1 excisionase [Enterococcus hulanensis]
MMNLALVKLDDLKTLLAENSIPNETWNSKQAAEYLTTSVSTLLKEVEKGNVPAIRIGKDWKFSSIAMYELLKNGGIKKM